MIVAKIAVPLVTAVFIGAASYVYIRQEVAVTVSVPPPPPQAQPEKPPLPPTDWIGSIRNRHPVPHSSPFK